MPYLNMLWSRFFRVSVVIVFSIGMIYLALLGVEIPKFPACVWGVAVLRGTMQEGCLSRSWGIETLRFVE